MLDGALDAGMSEEEFWSMTPAEIERKANSVKRVRLAEARERAAADYLLADLIGLSVGRIYSKNNTFPSIDKAYPNLFDTEDFQEKKRQAEMKHSEAVFRNFAESFNKRFKEERLTNE